MASKFEMVGLQLVFGTNAGFAAELTDISVNQSVEEIDISNSDSENYKEYQAAALQEPPEMSVTMLFDPTKVPPLGDAAETIEIQWPDGVGGALSSKWSGNGFLKEYNTTGSIGDVVKADATWRFTGSISVGTV